MTSERDYALTEDEGEPGKMLAHRADCPYARRHAAEGRPVLTMLGCEGPLPAVLRRHSCLDEN